MSEEFISQDDAHFKVDEEKIINEMVKHHNDIKALFTQRGQMVVALNGIRSKIKELKLNRNKTLQQIVGGKYIETLNNKECIKMLQGQRVMLDNQLKAIEAQIQHRVDNFYEAMSKIAFHMSNRMKTRGLDIPFTRMSHDETPSQEGENRGH